MVSFVFGGGNFINVEPANAETLFNWTEEELQSYIAFYSLFCGLVPCSTHKRNQIYGMQWLE